MPTVNSSAKLSSRERLHFVTSPLDADEATTPL
jgi:hypothetical protein